MIDIFHKSDHAGDLILAHLVHFSHGDRDVKWKGFACIKKFLGRNLKIVTDIKKSTHAGKSFFVFYFVNVAFA